MTCYIACYKTCDEYTQPLCSQGFSYDSDFSFTFIQSDTGDCNLLITIIEELYAIRASGG